MPLSSELISEFVKVTKDEAPKNKESTVYGTTVEYEGTIYVKLDGSDRLTPFSTTTDVKADERVMVMIKNHTATITGNISSPSARTDDVKDIGKKIAEFDIIVANKVNTEQLVAEQARIDNLIAEDVIIKNKLTATEGKIDDLEADNVVINETLTAKSAEIESLKTSKLDVEIATATYATIENLDATNANIHNLEVDYGDFKVLTAEQLEATDAVIKNLDATYATIENLNAERARINAIEADYLTADSIVVTTLKADVADINTLMFGSASGDVIQTSFANAVIAQLGNAQIKSAMIDSLSASKITSGDIYTNNVRILSEDGSLLISDETIQISDSARVRVQIGKDASNDYSINIWDENGNLMFSKGGITDNAIKDAIIRNDMVSETANIAASKLDISSLFEEINGSTHTIKSNRIYMDAEAQTLDVAFTDMSSDINDLSGSVSSQGTLITVMQGQINSKVWQEDIDAASNTLSTKYTQLEQDFDILSGTVASHTTQISEKADGSTVTAMESRVSELELGLDSFHVSVANTYTTKEEFANLSIGGRNLLRYTQDLPLGVDKIWSFTSGNTCLSDTEEGIKLTIESNSTCIKVPLVFDGAVKNGEKVTLSFDYRGNVPDSGVLYFLQRTEPNTQVIPSDRTLIVSETEWQHYECTFSSANANIRTCYALLFLYDLSAYTGGWIEIKDKSLKLEKGDKGTDWTPAPEDVRDDIVTLSKAVAEIDIKTDAISLSVTKQISDLEIGGRNLFSGYGEEELQLGYYQGTGSFTQFINNLTFDPSETVGETYTISFWAKSPNGETPLAIYNQNGEPRYFYFPRTTLTNNLGDEWEYFTYTFVNEDKGESYTGTQYNRIEIYASNKTGVLVKKIKVEKGNKATDWTPAPEDVNDGISEAQNDANNALSGLSEAQSTIKLLVDSINSLVRNGEDTSGTLVRQDANGLYYFDISGIKENVSTNANKLDSLEGIVYDAQGRIDFTKSLAEALQDRVEYIRCYTNENDQPCIELGEGDSKFKVYITNTSIDFMDDTERPAYISNRRLMIEKATVKDELQIGNDEDTTITGVWLWQRRPNGNLGLSWKEVNS